MALSQVPNEALPIRIKGTQDGLVVNVSEALGEDWLEILEAEFKAKPDFWRGGRVVLSVGHRELPHPRLGTALELLERYGMRLWAVLSENEETRRAARELSLAIRVPGLTRNENRERPPRVLHEAAPLPSFLREVEDEPEIEEPAPAPIQARGPAPVLQAVEEEDEPEEPPPPSGPQGPIALILKETLRSGRSVRHPGPIIVFGDVNPGAEVHAEGDVIVWGKLRGLVHAGSAGDDEAVVCALDLNPTQLRIADKITIPPKDPRRQPVPEMAVIRAQQIVAEPWRSKT